MFRQPALSIVQGDCDNVPLVALEEGQKHCQQCRFSGAVRPDDRAAPIHVAEPIGEAVGGFPLGKSEGNRPRTHTPGAERIGWDRDIQVSIHHGCASSGAGSMPSWKTRSPMISLPPSRKARTRTHQRTLRIAPL